MSYKSATIDDIIADAEDNGRVEYLKKLAKKKRKDGNKISFLELKREYYLKFYPDMVPVRPEPPKTFWDRIEDL